MYRSNLDAKHKGGALAAVAALHVGLAIALLHLTGTVDLTDVQEGLSVFDVTEAPPPPPPEPPPPPRQVQQEKPKEKEGGSAPKNIRSEATPVVAPLPRVEVPATPPIAASETPRQGAAPTQGASDVAGPGTGSGGTGTGTGSGSGGVGPGGGGGGGIAAVRARLATRPLRGRDFPPHILDAWPAGASIYMRHRVDADGNIIECIVDNGTGNAAIDKQICDITRQKLRYRPGLNRNRQRVADWAGYGQRPPR
jgi:periplasmic protein TonB